MAVSPGSFRPKSANAVIAKNAAATVTQSPKIVPYYRLVKMGGNSAKIAPLRSWLTRQ
jgi:hypothetical protein